MKRFLVIVAIVLLAACGGSPAPAAPAPTAVPAPTAIPLSAIDLESLLIQSGDLPDGVSPATAKPPPMFDLPAVYPDITPAQRSAFASIQTGKTTIGGMVVYLYESTTDRNRAYQIVLEGFGRGKTLGTVGEQAMLASVTGALSATEKLSGKTYTSVDLLFQRCHAIGYVRIRTTGDVEGMAKDYAKRLDARLAKVVC